MNFMSYELRKHIGYIHNLEDAINTVNPTVAGKIVSIPPLIQKSSLQQTSVLEYHVVEASPNKPSDKHSQKKLRILFIGDSAEIAATLPIDVGDEISFRNASFIRDSFFEFEERNSFYDMMLCIGSLSFFNRLKNMFYRKKDVELWNSLIGLEFKFIPTNIEDYEPVHRSKSLLYVQKSVNDNGMDLLHIKDVPTFTEDREFELLQASYQFPEM